MRIATACIRRPVMTTLVMLSFLVIGVFGYRQLPVAALPQVDFPTISVSAQLPGASPETMASSVASVLERQFATISGINSMTSTSTQGSTSIVLQFDLGRNIDGAALDVQSALSIAQRRLPDEMTTPPSFRKVNPADSPILFLALSSPSVPLSTVDEYAETLIAQQISMLSGVAQVQVYGAQKYAVRVQADLHALAARGLTLSDLQTAIANANSNSPVGNLDGPSRNYTIQATGPMRKAVDFMPVVVTYAGGNPVRIEDVATVIDSVENDKVASWFQGKRAIILAVQRQPDANTVDVVDRIRAALPVLRAGVPPSIAVDVLNDKSVSIRDSVRDVQFTLMIAIALVILVIFIFLRNATATHHSGPGAARLDHRDVRRDVSLRLLDRQSVAPGDHALGRLRRRRRHRHAREHRAPRRGGHAALRGRAQGCRGDRLHDRLDDRSRSAPSSFPCSSWAGWSAGSSTSSASPSA